MAPLPVLAPHLPLIAPLAPPPIVQEEQAAAVALLNMGDAEPVPPARTPNARDRKRAHASSPSPERPTGRMTRTQAQTQAQTQRRILLRQTEKRRTGDFFVLNFASHDERRNEFSMRMSPVDRLKTLRVDEDGTVELVEEPGVQVDLRKLTLLRNQNAGLYESMEAVPRMHFEGELFVDLSKTYIGRNGYGENVDRMDSWMRDRTQESWYPTNKNAKRRRQSEEDAEE